MRFAKLRPVFCSLVALGLAATFGCGNDDKPAVKKLDNQPAVAANREPEPPLPVATGLAKSEAGAAPAMAVAGPPPAEAVAPQSADEPGKLDEAPPIDLPPSFDERMAMGKRFARKGQVDLALVAFESAAALQPASDKPHVEIARALIGAGDLKTARSHADQAVALAPRSSAAWNTKGRILFAEKETDAAIYAFTKATQENGDNVYAWNNLGLALMAMEKWDDAITALETATGLPHPQPYMFANLGLAYENAGRLTEARAAYKAGSAHGSTESRQALGHLADVEASSGPPSTE
jgi:tetratricopeptide (TPR) repeat protein